MRKKIVVLMVLLALVAGFSLEAQVLTAMTIFNRMAEKYGALGSYTAQVTISTEDPKDPTRMVTMNGKLAWKRRGKLRIDFTHPREQVLLADGAQLLVYLSEYNVILSQKLDSEAANPGGMATPEGLAMIRRGYNIAFKTGAGLVPLGNDPAGEKGYRLALTWKSANQGFREMEMLVSEALYIRRIEGITADNRKVVIQFDGISLNPAIPDLHFTYNTPPGANSYEGFLFGNDN